MIEDYLCSYCRDRVIADNAGRKYVLFPCEGCEEIIDNYDDEPWPMLDERIEACIHQALLRY